MFLLEGGLVQGAVGEFITRSLNRFGGVWLDNPGFIQLETNVIHWFCNMMVKEILVGVFVKF